MIELNKIYQEINIPEINTERYLSPKDLDGEFWADISGWEDSHEVSNYGRVRTKERDVLYNNGRTHHYRSKILKVFVNSKGYCYVYLSNQTHKKAECSRRLHQVVLCAFEKKPEGCNQINHKDENKLNNSLDNLEWCDGKYNMNYGLRTDIFRRKVTNDPRRSKKVKQLDLNDNVLKTFPSLRQIQREYGFQKVHIREACNGKLKTAYGYKWEWG